MPTYQGVATEHGRLPVRIVADEAGQPVQIWVNGVDIARMVREFSVSMGPGESVPTVHVSLLPLSLDVDGPADVLANHDRESLTGVQGTYVFPQSSTPQQPDRAGNWDEYDRPEVEVDSADWRVSLPDGIVWP